MLLPVIAGMAVLSCSPKSLYRKAAACSQKGEYQKAIVILNKALEQDTTSVPYCLLIKAHSDYGKPDSAVSYLRLAQQKFPDDYLVHTYAGLYYLHNTHMFDSSRHYFTKAIEYFRSERLDLVFPQKVAELEDLRGVAIMHTWDSSICALHNGYMSFKKPENWTIQRLHEDNANAAIQFFVPMESTDNTRHSGNARIGIYTEADTVSLESKVADLKKAVPEGFTTIRESRDSPSAMTIIWTAKDEYAYLCINMYALIEDKSLEVMIAFPLIRKEDQPVWKTIVEDFNSVVAGIHCNGSAVNLAPIEYNELHDCLKGLIE